jgi:hypothetical protein
MEAYKKHSSIFSLLASDQYSVKFKKSLLSACPKEVKNFLIECSYNLLQGALQFSDQQKQKLKKSSRALREAAYNRSSRALLTKNFIIVLPILLLLVKSKLGDAVH